MAPADRWNRIEQLFQSALEMDEQHREAFLEQACADDHGLQSEIRSLLAYSSQADTFMEAPPLASGMMGPYRLIRVIASGGMGVVYEAEQQNPRRSVALKVVRGEADPRRLALFQREAESLARLEHPGIASIYDAGETEHGQHYLTMELVHGKRLTDYADERALTSRQRLELFGKVVDAIIYAHQKGVIHRDLKPSNILVSDESPDTGSGTTLSGGAAVKILDFGLARITDDTDNSGDTIIGTEIMGTLRYMSPEQARGESGQSDVRSDVYALGVLLYELLTRRLPYETTHLSAQEAIRNICEAPPERPGDIRRELRGDLEKIMLKAIEKDPQQRYQSASALKEDIIRNLEGQPVHAHPPSSLYQLKKLVGRHKLFVASAAVVLALTISFGIAASIMAARLAEEHEAVLQANESEVAARRDSEQIAAFLEEMLSSAHPDNAMGRDVLVREVVDRAANRVESELANQPRVAAAIHEAIGKTYHSLGLHGESETHLRAALGTFRRTHGGAQDSVIRSFNNLAMLLIDQGRYDEAGKHSGQALKLAGVLDPEQPQLIALSLNSEGCLLRARGDYEPAEQRFREALRIRREHFGNQGREVATSINNLAALRQARADYHEAGGLYRESLAMRRELLGDSHPDVANSLNNLAMLHLETGNHEAAQPLFEEVLALQRKLVGDKHRLVAATLNNLAMSLKATGKLDESESLLRQALDMQQEVLGRDHPEVADTLNNLGVLLYARRDFDVAERMLRDSLAIRLKVIEGDHPHVARNLNDLAAVLYAKRDFNRAAPLYEQALKIYRELMEEDHPRIALIMNNLGSLNTALGKLESARDYYQRSLAVFSRTLGEEHPNLVGPLMGLGTVQARLGDHAAAEPLMRRCIDFLRKTRPAHDPSIVKSELRLASSLAQLQRFEEAEQRLLAVLEAVRNQARARKAVTERLAKIYQQWGRPAKAEELLAKQ